MIKMDALRKMMEGLGFKNVKSYIQSGNVVFESKLRSDKDLEKQIAEQIRIVFGFEVPVLVKGVEELKETVKNNPFVNKRKEDSSKLHITFLSEEAEKTCLARIREVKSEPDEFMLSGKSLYLFCPNGYGNTKLNNNFFESKLKVRATTRNWKTINELINIAEKS